MYVIKAEYNLLQTQIESLYIAAYPITNTNINISVIFQFGQYWRADTSAASLKSDLSTWHHIQQEIIPTVNTKTHLKSCHCAIERSI